MSEVNCTPVATVLCEGLDPPLLRLTSQLRLVLYTYICVLYVIYVYTRVWSVTRLTRATLHAYRDTSLIGNCSPIGLYSRPMSGALW